MPVAHNVLLVDDKEFQRTDGKIEDWESNAGFDYVRATHPDYAPLATIAISRSSRMNTSSSAIWLKAQAITSTICSSTSRRRDHG